MWTLIADWLRQGSVFISIYIDARDTLWHARSNESALVVIVVCRSLDIGKRTGQCYRLISCTRKADFLNKASLTFGFSEELCYSHLTGSIGSYGSSRIMAIHVTSTVSWLRTAPSGTDRETLRSRNVAILRLGHFLLIQYYQLQDIGWLILQEMNGIPNNLCISPLKYVSSFVFWQFLLKTLLLTWTAFAIFTRQDLGDKIQNCHVKLLLCASMKQRKISTA